MQPIQVLRALAALFVVVLHSYTRVQLVNPGTSSSISSLFAMSGNAGVDLFFVISGYIMFHVHHDDFGKGRSWTFMTKRVVRIAPIYWILTTVALLILVFLPNLFTKVRGFDALWVAGSYLFFPVAYPPALDTPLLQVGWTLNYEAYFYVILALCLALDRTKAVIAISSLFVGSVILGELVAFRHPWPQLLTSWLLLEFLLGGFIALIQHAFGDRWRGLHMAGLALGMLLLVASFPSGNHEDALERFIVWGIPAVLIVNGVCRLDREVKGWLGRLAVTLGDASYSIYLVQVFTLPAAALALNKSGLMSTAPADMSVFFLTVSTATVGWLTWRIVERPSTRWLRGRLENPR